MKCPHCVEGDDRFGHEFKNQMVLDMHIKHKHKDTSEEDGSVVDPVEDPAEPTKADLGIEEGEASDVMCDQCGTDIKKPYPDKCPNCGTDFGD